MNKNLQPVALITGAIIIFSVGIALGHSLGESAKQPRLGTEDVVTATESGTDDKAAPPRYEKFINGDGVLCMRDNQAGGLSCDFAKYNAAVKACEDAQLEKNTYLDKNGETLIFPLMEGECEAKVKTEVVEAFELALARSKIVWH